MSEHLQNCHHCGFHYEGALEFCPQCKVRLGHFVKTAPYIPTVESLKGELSENEKELRFAANVCATLAGLSMGWPFYSLGLYLFQDISSKALLAMLFGLVPAVVGLVLFALASMAFNSEARSKSGASSLGGVICALMGVAAWWSAGHFVLTTKL